MTTYEPVTAQPNEQDSAAPLTNRERRILQFEAEWGGQSGAKERAIRAEFDLSSTRYYQLLNRLIDAPAALRFDPMLVGRLLRLRDARREARA